MHNILLKFKMLSRLKVPVNSYVTEDWHELTSGGPSPVDSKYRP